MLDNKAPQRITVVDSHTGGEPTRTITDGGPPTSGKSMASVRKLLEVEHDYLRTALLHEPRGSDVMVGALLCPPQDDSCIAGVVFFNNVGYLNMCGHGMMGVVTTLAHLKRIDSGVHKIETPVGIVTVQWHGAGRVSVTNVPSYRYRKAVRVAVDGYGDVCGDIAWGGNWFFLTEHHGQEIELARVDELTRYCQTLRNALERDGQTGENGGLIDHIELFTPGNEANSTRNFVLCPGGVYDRSPCGTGTSAKVACLAADGKLAEGEIWRQTSVVGSVFEGSYRRDGDRIIPTVTGEAFVNAELTILLDPLDPFATGIPLS